MRDDAERDQDRSGSESRPASRQEDTGYTRLLRAAPIVILLLVFATFAIQNAERVELEFGWTFETRRITLLIGTAMFGVLVWELGRFVIRWRRDRSDKTS